MDQDLAQFCVAYAGKKGASYVEARVEDSFTHSFVLKNGIPQVSGFQSLSGLGVRVIVNKAMAFFSTNKDDKGIIKQLIEKSIRLARDAKRIAEEVTLADDHVYKDHFEVQQKIKLEDVSVEEKMQLLFDADKTARSQGVNVSSTFLVYSDDIVKEYTVTSEGTAISSVIPKVNMYYILTVHANNKNCQRYWVYGGSGGYDIVKGWNVPSIMQQEVLSMHKNLVQGVKPPKGKIDVVVCPQVVGIMVHESVGHPQEADRILGREAAQAGESFITKEMLGHQIGSDVVTVVDDPTIEHSYGYYHYDNEGVKARRKFLINKGIITEFLHNRETAACMGIKSNGSARASDYAKEPIVRMSNTFLLPGEQSEEELIEDIKLGVLMKNFQEWNIDDQRLNQKYVGCESYLIKKGKIVKPVYQPTIEITTPNLWKCVDAVAKNMEYHAGNCGKSSPMQAAPVWFGGPSMRIRGIRLQS